MCKEIVIHALKLEVKMGKKAIFLDTTNGSLFFITSSGLSFFSLSICCLLLWFFCFFFFSNVFRFKCNFQSFYLLLTVCNVTNYYRAYWCVYTVYDVQLLKSCLRPFANLLYFPLDSSSSTTMLHTELRFREPQTMKCRFFTFLGYRKRQWDEFHFFFTYFFRRKFN